MLRGELSPSEAARRAGLSGAELLARRQRYLESKLPGTHQALRAGVRQPVRIVRDAGWVPHIYAENPRDLFFGQGFAMAQDRLWQMDFLRRRALGRLAEVLGAAMVESDRESRILGFGHYANREVAGTSAEAGEALESFAAGINAWIEQTQANLPIEFDVLEYEPEPWTPRDSLALLRAYYWHLTGRLATLAAGEAARRVLGEHTAVDFLRTELPDETILPSDSATADQQLVVPIGATGGSDGLGGSNNWAVAPARSASGHAMLATDPHVPYALPTGYYQAHLAGGGYDVAGAGHAGAPGIKFGHNGRVAWGITNLVASARDLYVETLHPGDPHLYRQDEAWAAFETRTETISVRHGAPVDLEVTSTVRGPLVDELVPPLDEPNGGPLSLRWVGHEQLNDMQGVLNVNRARDWPSFRLALSEWRLPIFNVVYADADGHIGWQAVGSIPIRGQGDTSRGFRMANDPAHAWRGFIPFDALPRLEDPPRGWIATANNRPVDDHFHQPLYGWWAPGQRAARLRQIFESRQQLTRTDMHSMHFDAHSIRAELVVPRLRQLLVDKGSSAGRRFAELLSDWDYQYRPDRVAATVFETFVELWVERVVRARFPESVQPFLIALGAGSGLSQRLITDGRPTDWFVGSTIEQQADETAGEALAELTARLGKDSAAWRWGAVHRVSFRHPLDGLPGAPDLFATPPREAHGTSHTLNNNGYEHGRRFDVIGGPEFRMVVDFADLDATETVLTTGQSGQPGSPHYADMTEPWRLGRYIHLPFTPTAVERASTDTVHLEPG
jgi:penicillin amidase